MDTKMSMSLLLRVVLTNVNRKYNRPVKSHQISSPEQTGPIYPLLYTKLKFSSA